MVTKSKQTNKKKQMFLRIVSQHISHTHKKRKPEQADVDDMVPIYKILFLTSKPISRHFVTVWINKTSFINNILTYVFLLVLFEYILGQ